MKSVFSKLWNHQHWAIGLVRERTARFLEQGFQPDVNWFAAPTFAADPFLVHHEGKTAILYEEFDYRSHRGRISAVEFTDSGFGTVFRNVIEDEFHFSYPFCLHIDGELYCIPEHNKSGRLAAYRCVRFPDQWTFDRVLMDSMPIVDPTIFQYEEHWWLSCTRQDRGSNSQLYLFYGPSPLGPWKEHAGNPVKVSPMGSRPAGAVFENDGTLYRPSQDCSTAYGGSIVIQKIQILNPLEFREETARRIEPIAGSPYRRGTHHIAGLGNWTVIDGCRSTFSAYETAFVLKGWSQKLIRR